MQYSSEIQNVVNSALSELKQSHAKGRLANTPITNTHFLARWVTTALKSQRFHACVRADLVAWQKLCRSQGAGSVLLQKFEQISALYGKYLPLESEAPALLDSQIEAFMDHMEALGWEVVNEFEVTEKIQVFADQPNSFVLCAKQCAENFDGAELNKPMSFYVRGNHAEFIQQATAQGFLLHKQTDYKSLVKYHGEYVIHPRNQGKKLVEIPLNFLTV